MISEEERIMEEGSYVEMWEVEFLCWGMVDVESQHEIKKKESSAMEQEGRSGGRKERSVLKEGIKRIWCDYEGESR